MTSTEELVVGLAQHLDAIGLARYSETGAYGAGSLPAIFFGGFPDTPGRALTIRQYDQSNARDNANADHYVQIRSRCESTDPLGADVMADALFDALHDRSHFTLPNGVGVKLCTRKIRGVADPDIGGRYSRPDSYIFTLDAKAST